MDALTDRKAVQLSELIALYFDDCRAEDPGCTPASELTVLQLLEDLAMSTAFEDSTKIEELIDRVNG